MNALLFILLLTLVSHSCSLVDRPPIRLNVHRSLLRVDTERSKPPGDELFKRGDEIKRVSSNRNEISVVFSQALGSKFLDYSFAFSLPSSATVAELKEHLHDRYPVQYPLLHTSKQKQKQKYLPLYCDGKLLSDDFAPLRKVWKSTEAMPLAVDLITGGGDEERLKAVARGSAAAPQGSSHKALLERLDAIAALQVKDHFVQSKLMELYRTSPNSNTDPPALPLLPTLQPYRQLLRVYSESLRRQHEEGLVQAQRLDSQPEIGKTATGLVPSDSSSSPLRDFVLRNFDFEPTSLRSYSYASVMLWLFAMFGTDSPLSRTILLRSIALLWASRVQLVRYLSNVALYTLLPFVCKIFPIEPLLPAPTRAIINNWDDLVNAATPVGGELGMGAVAGPSPQLTILDTPTDEKGGREGKDGQFVHAALL